MNKVISTILAFLALTAYSNGLICNTCSNCLFTPVVAQTCASNQPYCFVQTQGNVITAGCAATCQSGTNVRCCTGNYCNTIPKAPSCYTCANCLFTPVTTQACAATQPYCYTQTTGINVNAGCAASCTPGPSTTCCTSANCNYIQKASSCYTCTNCLYSTVYSQQCSAAQPYCYVQKSGDLVSAGCAGQCVPGTNTKCCASSNCNTIPNQCYSCTNCQSTFNLPLQTCELNQPYCFKTISGSYVTRGCAATCVQGTNTKCCTTTRCNDSPSSFKSNFSLLFILSVFGLFLKF